MDIFSTYYMLAAVRELPIEHTFFRNRYFPTDMATDVFGTSRVLADYADETSKKVAPFVLPRVGAIPVGRDGFATYELEPAHISISRPLTLDQLERRGLGESIMSENTPEEREKFLLINDLASLSSMISRTEEILAINTILDNGCTMKHITDKPGIYKDIPVKFYDGESNPNLFTPANTWTHSTYSNGTWTPGNWYTDVCTIVKSLVQNGRPVKELVVASDVGAFLLEDGWILAMLDNRRAEMGRIAPSELTEYMTYIGTFNFKGRMLDIIIADGTYENDAGADVAYVPAGTVIAIAPNVGKGLFGAVTQMEDDGQFHTYAGTRVPQYNYSKQPPVKEVIVSARPLFVPLRTSSWRVAKNVFDA